MMRTLMVLAAGSMLLAGVDPERLKAAKSLFFDHRYAEARESWAAIERQSTGGDADAALFWKARCSEELGDSERALADYGLYLSRKGTDPAVREEVLTRRVGLATRLYRAGNRSHIGLVTEALESPLKTVRYYAALQLGGLGREAGPAAVPTLRRIVEEEKDPDLVDRARLLLLRLDPSALASPPVKPPRGEARWLKVRVYKPGVQRPTVSVNLPLDLAEMVFKSLPDEARDELRKKGYDAGNFFERMRKMGPTEVVRIEGDDGEVIEITLE